MPYLPALDGLRALAVTAVLLYHAGLARAGGGFLGVDLFFVLSGFLITSLLVSERGRTGRISLAHFWGRRARRLLPALFVMLAAVAAYAAFLAPAGSLGDLRRAALATLGYAANWNQIVGGQGYFAQLGAPSPLLHTWSLAIEEQFYLVWPLLVTALLALGRGRRRLLPLLAFTAGAAAASAGAMAVLFHGGAGLDRVYYGTDTRAQDLLVGAALAAVLHMRREPWAAPASRRARAALAAAGAGGLAALVGAVVVAGGSSAWLYHGGFLALAVGAAALVAAAALAPGGLWGRALAVAPARYVGRISYGLYLWHWPVFLVLDHARTGLSGPGLLGARLTASLAVAAASYHLVEVPIRRGALARWRAWVGTPAAAGGVAVAVLVGTVAPAGATLAPAAGGAAAAAILAAAPPPAGPTTGGAGSVEAGTDSVLPAVPAGAAGRVRVLLVGDSSATVLSLGFSPTQAYGVDLGTDAVIGCGLVTGGLVANRGTVSDEKAGLRTVGRYVRCDTWPARWAADVARFHPDVVALMEGPWEVRDRYVHGRWSHLGQPAADVRELAALQQAVRVLDAGGATVALLTAPYDDQPEQADGRPQPADDPARTDRYNQLVRRAAAGFRGRAVVVDLGGRLSPGGRYARTLGATTVRAADGIHLTADGARLVEPWLLASLRSLSPRRAT